MIGMPLEAGTLLPDFSEHISIEGYRLSHILSSETKAAVFLAEDPQGKGSPVRVKLYHPQAAEKADMDKLLKRIVTCQANMNDPNVVKVLGTATVQGKKVIIYEHLPVTMEDLLAASPEGLPLDELTCLLPQILNGLGYSHTHRGKDGIARRLPH